MFSIFTIVIYYSKIAKGPVIGWQHVQGEPCLLPACSTALTKGWMDVAKLKQKEKRKNKFTNKTNSPKPINLNVEYTSLIKVHFFTISLILIILWEN